MLGPFGIVGLFCAGRGIKELLTREVVTPPGVRLTGRAPPVAPVPRLIPESEARALLRQIAERHRQAAVLRQLDRARSEGTPGPVSLFVDDLYFVVSRRRRCTPGERLSGALRSFARACDPEEVPLLFLDTSWRRNGRAGVLLTNRRLYSSRLRGPIELQDVTRVAFKDPSGGEMVFKLLVFGVHCMFGSILILGGPLFPRRLVVNGKSVFVGRPGIDPNFWVDLLTTFGETARWGGVPCEGGPAPTMPGSSGIIRPVGLPTDPSWAVWAGPARRPGVTALETLPHSAEGVPLAAESIDAPSWEQVERSIRGLDGHAHPLVRLWTGKPREPHGLEIIGGNGKYALREVGDGWVYYDPNGAEEEVAVQTSGAGHRCAGYYVCTDVEHVLRIARRYYETGRAGEE
jgi:hypothetical protein